jgi:hypothetical protein
MGSEQIFPCVLRISISDMLALRVRTQQPNAPQLPEFLYQQAPVQGLGLIATLPQKNIQVSIPYPIEKRLPPSSDGLVLIYALQPNRRYEAIEALYEHQNYTIMQLHSLAKNWLGSQKQTAAAGGHRFFHPDVDQWGVIRRDNGYVANFGAFPEMHHMEISRLTSGVTIRLPARSAPRFEQVELALDHNPCEKSRWMSFDEYASERARQSKIPEILNQNFREWEIRLAEESGLKSWVFSEGMLFLDRMEWWGTKNRRRTEHEGIDFALGKDAGNVSSIPSGTPVRAIAGGEVVAILNDFLGKTILVQHSTIRNKANIFYTLYSHIQPVSDLPAKAYQGQILGVVGESKSGSAPMHLHLTAAWIPESILPGQLTMDHINHAFAPIVLVNLNELAATRVLRLFE